jgi:hypothetical protein
MQHSLTFTASSVNKSVEITSATDDSGVKLDASQSQLAPVPVISFEDWYAIFCRWAIANGVNPISRFQLRANISSWVERYDRNGSVMRAGGELNLIGTNDETLNNLAAIKMQLTPLYLDALFYDYSCSHDDLDRRGNILMNYLGTIWDSPKIDIINTEVFFNNNCFGLRKYFDDIDLCDSKTFEVIYKIIPKIMRSGADKGKSAVYGRENDFKKPLVKGHWEDVEIFFMAEVVNTNAVKK